MQKEIDKIFKEIKKERKRQDEKWGEQNHIAIKWCAILGEEVGEVNKAVLESKYDDESLEKYKKELIQVAAVAVAALECVERLNGYIKLKKEKNEHKSGKNISRR